MQWQEWNAVNQRLLDEWRKLLVPASMPSSYTPLASLFNELTDDTLCVFETSRGCMHLSGAWERVTGHRASASLKSDFYARLHPECVKPFVALLQQAVAEGLEQTELCSHRFRVMRADGGVVTHELRIGSILPAEKGQQYIVCLLKNVHAAHEAHEQLKAARQEAERALKTRSEFLNGMSHNLRTPLNAVLGFTQIMETGMYGAVENPQHREYLRHIRESSYDLLAQIDNIMDIASIDSGNVRLRTEKVDLHALLSQAAALYTAKAEEGKVAFNNRVAAGMFTLRADGVKLQHCISHVLANALAHSKPGGEVTLEAELAFDELHISVEDAGEGMPASRLGAVISALQRDDSWAMRGANGLGLGLPLAKEFARLHGGYLTLESREGVGTRVSVCLPASCLALGAKPVAVRAAMA